MKNIHKIILSVTVALSSQSLPNLWASGSTHTRSVHTKPQTSNPHNIVKNDNTNHLDDRENQERDHDEIILKLAKYVIDECNRDPDIVNFLQRGLDTVFGNFIKNHDPLYSRKTNDLTLDRESLKTILLLQDNIKNTIRNSEFDFMTALWKYVPRKVKESYLDGVTIHEDSLLQYQKNVTANNKNYGAKNSHTAKPETHYDFHPEQIFILLLELLENPQASLSMIPNTSNGYGNKGSGRNISDGIHRFKSLEMRIKLMERFVGYVRNLQKSHDDPFDLILQEIKKESEKVIPMDLVGERFYHSLVTEYGKKKFQLLARTFNLEFYGGFPDFINKGWGKIAKKRKPLQKPVYPWTEVNTQDKKSLVQPQKRPNALQEAKSNIQKAVKDAGKGALKNAGKKTEDKIKKTVNDTVEGLVNKILGGDSSTKQGSGLLGNFLGGKK